MNTGAGSYRCGVIKPIVLLRCVALIAFAGLIVLPGRHDVMSQAGAYASGVLLVAVLAGAMTLRLRERFPAR